MRSRTSASSARRPPAIRNTATPTGIETTTGPLGQGLANAVGMAMAEAHLQRALRRRSRRSPHLGHRGDGCLMEGISQEALALAGHQKLNKLIVLWDDNSISIDGAVSLSDITDQKARFAASGWNVLACDGHDMADVARALRCRDQVRQAGADRVQDHHRFWRAEEGRHRTRRTAKRSAPKRSSPRKARSAGRTAPFEIPDNIRNAWRKIGARGAERSAACGRPSRSAPNTRAAFARRHCRRQCRSRDRRARMHARRWPSEKPTIATRASSGGALDAHVRGCARTDRRLGRSHRLEQYATPRARPISRRRIAPAATSTTASASTAWPRR